MKQTQKLAVALNLTKSAAPESWTGMALDMLPGVGTYRQGQRAFQNIMQGNLWSGAGNAIGAAATLLPGAGMGFKALGGLVSKALPTVAKGVGRLGGMASQAMPGVASGINRATTAVTKALNPVESTGMANTGAGKWLTNNSGKTQLFSGLAGAGAKGVGGSAAESIAGQADNFSSVLQNITRQPQNVNPIWQSPSPAPMGSGLT